MSDLKFSGRHDHRAHSKHRVGFPAPWRALLSEGMRPSGDELFAFMHPAGAIAVVPAALKPAVLRGVDGWVHERASELLLIVAEEITYCGATVRPDPQGRVVMPRALCDYAAVAQEPRDEMTWVGKGPYAELWRRERWEGRMRSGRYGAPEGCDWNRDDVRELAATFETTMRRLTGAVG